MAWTPRFAEPPALRPGEQSVALLRSPDEWHARDVVAVWESLLAATDNPLALFATPGWLDNKHATKAHQETPLAACVRDGDGRTSGVVPLVASSNTLTVGAGRIAFHIRLRALHVLGEEAPLPEDGLAHDRLFASILASILDADTVQTRLIRTCSFAYRWILHSPAIRRRFLVFVRVVSQHHLIVLPPSFSDYTKRFSSRHRYNLRNRVRTLREHGGDSLDLDRIARPEQVTAFLREGSAIARKSWQHDYAGYLIKETPEWRAHLEDLATRGMLRCYLLRCGGIACAYVLGFQGCGTYHYSFVGYDPAFREFAPGTVMLYLLIEDLIAHDRPARLSFGFGDEPYKSEFGNASFEIATVILFRKTIRNRLRLSALTGYRSLVSLAKRLLRR